MKINTKEIEKIKDKVEDIPGWEVEDFKMWEKKSGGLMSTIRLAKTEETDDNENTYKFIPGEEYEDLYKYTVDNGTSTLKTTLIHEDDNE